MCAAKKVGSTKTTKGDEGESEDDDSRENMTLEVLARSMNKGRKSDELEDNATNVGDKKEMGEKTWVKIK